MKKIVLLLTIIFTVSILHSEKVLSILSRGIVKDNSTGLIWTRCSLSDDDKPIYDFNCKKNKKLYSWAEAVNVCKNLSFEGRSDWRLPNIRELQSILFFHHYSTGNEKYSQVVEQAFPGVVTSEEFISSSSTIHYWSSTTHANNSIYVWFADFKLGNAAFSGQTFFGSPIKKYVRCVAGP